MVCVTGFGFNGANLYGYIRCKMGGVDAIKSYANNFLGKQVLSRFFDSIFDSFCDLFFSDLWHQPVVHQQPLLLNQHKSSVKLQYTDLSVSLFIQNFFRHLPIISCSIHVCNIHFMYPILNLSVNKIGNLFNYLRSDNGRYKRRYPNVAKWDFKVAIHTRISDAVGKNATDLGKRCCCTAPKRKDKHTTFNSPSTRGWDRILILIRNQSNREIEFGWQPLSSTLLHNE